MTKQKEGSRGVDIANLAYRKYRMLHLIKETSTKDQILCSKLIRKYVETFIEEQIDIGITTSRRNFNLNNLVGRLTGCLEQRYKRRKVMSR
jgi:hypothetical protein